MKLNEPMEVKLSVNQDAKGFFVKGEMNRDGKVVKTLIQRFQTLPEAMKYYNLMNEAMAALDEEDLEVIKIEESRLQ